MTDPNATDSTVQAPDGAGTGVSGASGSRIMIRKLLIMVGLMFGFGYAMVPIYNKICEITGVNFLTQRDDAAAQFANNTVVDVSRKVSVVFDSNSRGAWRFKPEQTHIDVHPGELVTIVYDLVNTKDHQSTGQAIPSYAPMLAAQYFKKIECFCFDQQTLGPNSSKKFPVVFVIDPELPKDIGSITLSYTYFEVEGLKKPSAVPVARAGGQDDRS